jgi:poly [ADP-ribose] polymerase
MSLLKEVENYEITDIILDPQIIFLLNTISDEKIINNSLESIGIDHTRIQVNKINKLRIEKANEILLNLANVLKIQNKIDEEICKELSDEYDRYIPYKKQDLLNNADIIKKHMENMEIINNIYQTYQAIIKNKKQNVTITQYISVYKALNIKINVVQKDSEKFLKVMECVNFVKNNYQIHTVYEINNEQQNKIYDDFTQNIKNKKLLFHGSPITNWFSILKNGFYINPNKIGVKINGKAYGNGIYFSDHITYSYNYCFINSHYNSDVIILGLCEVALCEKSYQTSPIYVIFNTNQYTFRYLVCLKR